MSKFNTEIRFGISLLFLAHTLKFFNVYYLKFLKFVYNIHYYKYKREIVLVHQILIQKK